MSVSTAPQPGISRVHDQSAAAQLANPAYQGYLLLRIGFVVAPVLFGLDKFFDVLVNWERYLAPAINDLVPGNAHQAMLAVGVIEIVAGLVVALRPASAATCDEAIAQLAGQGRTSPLDVFY